MHAALDLNLLDPSQLRAARDVASRLHTAGHRGLIVGGAVRDLALGRCPKDLDMVSKATPEEIESLFERTLGVGRAFGVMIVQIAGQEVELATFRVDGSYSDGRRPDDVVYGDSLELDAERRDFTCNALYLDPLNGEVLDPTGGLQDLSQSLLRTVGDPARRFREDGLRLLRMVRFEASHGLRPAPKLHAAARAEARNLARVSPERVLQEYLRTFAAPHPERAYSSLAACELIAPSLPNSLAHGELRAQALAALPSPEEHAEWLPQPALLALSILIEPKPLAPLAAAGPELESALLALRPSKQVLATCVQLAELRRELSRLAQTPIDRPTHIRTLRNPLAQPALSLTRAWATAQADSGLAQALDELEDWSKRERPNFHPAQLLSPRELMAAGVSPGPRLGQILRELEDAQLRGEIQDVEQAYSWLSLRDC